MSMKYEQVTEEEEVLQYDGATGRGAKGVSNLEREVKRAARGKFDLLYNVCQVDEDTRDLYSVWQARLQVALRELPVRSAMLSRVQSTVVDARHKARQARRIADLIESLQDTQSEIAAMQYALRGSGKSSRLKSRRALKVELELKSLFQTYGGILGREYMASDFDQFINSGLHREYKARMKDKSISIVPVPGTKLKMAKSHRVKAELPPRVPSGIELQYNGEKYSFDIDSKRESESANREYALLAASNAYSEFRANEDRMAAILSKYRKAKPVQRHTKPAPTHSLSDYQLAQMQAL